MRLATIGALGWVHVRVFLGPPTKWSLSQGAPPDLIAWHSLHSQSIKGLSPEMSAQSGCLKARVLSSAGSFGVRNGGGTTLFLWQQGATIGGSVMKSQISQTKLLNYGSRDAKCAMSSAANH